MNRKRKKTKLTGTISRDVQPYEVAHRKVAKAAAEEGFVLLKNDHQVLPVAKGSKLALYGAGASNPIKGGTGSGDVNEREVVSIYDGLKQAGYEITTEDWIENFRKQYEQSRLDWRQKIWDEADKTADDSMSFFNAYASMQYAIPAGDIPEKTDAQTAVYVISRIAGEAADRFDKESDYYLNQKEEEILKTICTLYKEVILLINSGGIIDLSFLDSYANISGVVLISQPGMETGHAVASLFTGEVTPSGKLTDTWAYKYEDYPNSKTFSHNNGNVQTEKYEEGIYVGYRYFDTFQVPVRYPFGYGLSYTDFHITVKGIAKEADDSVSVTLSVANTGSVYSGKEVVQLYVSCPQESMEKEYRRLAGFAKTALLAPGQSQTLTIKIPLYTLASFCPKTPGWILEKGVYGLFVGNSIAAAALAGTLNLDADVLLVKTEHICPLKEELQELSAPKQAVQALRNSWLAQAGSVPSLSIEAAVLQTKTVVYGNEKDNISPEVWQFVDSLDTEQLTLLATGDPGKSQNASDEQKDSALGSAGISVPGSAAQTSSCALKDGNLAPIVLADGPAGLRLLQSYPVVDGEIRPVPFEMSIEHGFLTRKVDLDTDNAELYYQYCTAFPIGTLLAQTWDRELLQEVGKAVAEEMNLFCVTLWLAPGMNIHRNPLCGRNFEYYSEDPLLSGKMAAAMTDGVQSLYGCGTTIKHFACNNQEDNRMGSDSVISERTLREIYLKGFEIAVKESQPMSIMTSYNLINGIHAANNYDLCTKAARDEWGFAGVIMTDWTTTQKGPDCTASGCMRAGNDLVMPGVPNDHKDIKTALKDGSLTLDQLKLSIAHLVNIVWKSNRYEAE
ncbi:glycoside hydrolase family 3 protein [Parablautia muri]|uniref:Beta-glucosidase n=1 Tax=Parablautia muri TaxID=2320879 RepID=A0A9X5GTS7_9FIRM|nr:glycoside hydrolase family 3 protein [Parablautia muri]NBJ94331.1 beta-glucosidase [Parablautia muri]